MIQKITMLALCLLSLAACTKQDSPDNTAWNMGGETFQGSNVLRADNAMMIKTRTNTSYLYARFANGAQVASGAYRVVEGVPSSPFEISFSANRNGQDYISTASGNPTATVTYDGGRLSILVSNVWMLHLPFRQDSLLLDAVMIEP